MKYAPILLAACSSILFTSCGKKNETGTSSTTSEVSSQWLDAVILKSAPADAQSIAQIRSTELTPGATITLKGKVMGNDSPFVAGQAMVLLGDPDKLTSCDLKPDDSCTQPWDVCCDTPEDKKNFIATIQVVGPDGKLIKQGLKGFQGMKELSHIIVTGTIAEGSNANNLLINATGIFVKP